MKKPTMRELRRELLKAMNLIARIQNEREWIEAHANEPEKVREGCKNIDELVRHWSEN